MSSSPCPHYDRGCDIKCIKCEASEWFACRLCHDEREDEHRLPRHDTVEIRCRKCKLVQHVSNRCGESLRIASSEEDNSAIEEKEGCGLIFGVYYCKICRLWVNNEGFEAYHCEKCGICRRGKGLGIDYFHCDTCM